ncbi:hypothetical protein ACFYUR_19275 [Micromonospora haikouensis]|uniref:hypothetical protein n=1 Tax=Micromonospora haikouensis TaxID=686309 RepID=UPI00367B12A4
MGAVSGVVEQTTTTVKRVTDVVDTVTAPLPVVGRVVDRTTDATDRILDTTTGIVSPAPVPADPPGSDPDDEPTSPPSTTTPSRDSGPQTAPEPAPADNPHDRAGSGADHTARQYPAATNTRTGQAAPAADRHHTTATAGPDTAVDSTHPGQHAGPCTGGATSDTLTGSSQPYTIVGTWRPQPTHPQTAQGRDRPHHGRTCPAEPPTG